MFFQTCHSTELVSGWSLTRMGTNGWKRKEGWVVPPFPALTSRPFPALLTLSATSEDRHEKTGTLPKLDRPPASEPEP
jgi:hypothetical protein